MTILQPPQLKQHDNLVKWDQLIGSSMTAAIAHASTPGIKIVVVPDIQTAYQTRGELQFYKPNDKVLLFPDWEILPYDNFSAHEDIISDRLATLSALAENRIDILVTAASTLMHKIAPKLHTLAQTFILKTDDKMDSQQFRERLVQSGYHNTKTVWHHGEFAVRGSIIDVFPMGSDAAIRIELFDDEIVSLRTFDTESQKTINKIDSVCILPATEFPLDEPSIERFRKNWRDTFTAESVQSPVYKAISDGCSVAGIEYYLPLFYESMATLFDYIPDNATYYMVGEVQQQFNHHFQDITHRYEQYRHNTAKPLLPPNELFLNSTQIYTRIKSSPKVLCSPKQNEHQSHVDFGVAALKSLELNHQLKHPASALNEFILDSKLKIIIVTESQGRQESILEHLRVYNIKVDIHPDWASAIASPSPLVAVIGRLQHGFTATLDGIHVITEKELYANTVRQSRRRKTSATSDAFSSIQSLTELQIGQPVVHMEFGVGRYQGLKTLDTGRLINEFLELEYANEDRIYVPISSLNLISRYNATHNENTPLQKLGTQQWTNAKNKALKRIHDVAAELLEIYSKREASSGFQCLKPDENYQRFKEDFPFEETIDQSQAILSVIDDMTSTRAMDRVVCGDVGFGKTEVAMQSAFLAIMSSKQVAVLVPTTLLANQHLKNFSDRFAGWPIKVAVLSRLQTKKEQNETIEQLKTGKVDILIGTHRVLSEDVDFKDLGLLIVDEEHRFGVRHKEKIKSLRANVDILTLTATPIPRTLNMALSGTRDLSIIATPPQKRLKIKTFHHSYNSEVIKEAISREILRGGQVFYCHNTIDTMGLEVNKITELCPEARCVIAHGQLPERELEKIMSDFYHQKFNVLVATTIIESGIDVPTANTIIINKAHCFGLAQLHQLRGRVGRSHHQAYAYLLTPDRKALTADAKKRLDAFSSMDDLGAGFTLATHDLEIRGAGELLGDDQSGHINAIGFTLYMDILDKTVKALRSGKKLDMQELEKSSCTVDMGVTSLFPESYMPDPHVRLNFYKRLSASSTVDDITDIKVETIDRFGLLPEEAERVFLATQLRLNAEKCGVSKVELRKDTGMIVFSESPKIDHLKLIQLIQGSPARYSLKGASTLKINLSDPMIYEKVNCIHNVLNSIALT